MPALQPISLSTLTGTISKVIDANFYNRTYWVLAEIINLRFYPQKGYYFLDLIEKDPGTNTIITSIKASAWSQGVKRIGYFEKVTGRKFDNNITVLLLVGVEYHISYGLKLNILDVDPAFTIGQLEQQRQATLQRLIHENPGYVTLIDGDFQTFNKSLEISPVIKTIALIGSPGSDGYNDFKHELENNQYGYSFRVDDYPVQVQGTGMEKGIVEKLISIFKSGIAYDVVVIVRGGGSQTDFLIFDAYEPAKAVARFPIPVLTGIGHTRNETITDLMAFMATKTPTKVAEAIISHNRLFEQKVLACGNRIFSKAGMLLQREQNNLTLRKALIRERVKYILHSRKFHIASLQTSIRQMALNQIAAATNDIMNLAHLVKYLSPSNVLKRGYALIYQDGQIITDPRGLMAGSTINVITSDSTINSVITEIINGNEGNPNL